MTAKGDLAPAALTLRRCVLFSSDGSDAPGDPCTWHPVPGRDRVMTGSSRLLRRCGVAHPAPARAHRFCVASTIGGGRPADITTREALVELEAAVPASRVPSGTAGEAHDSDRLAFHGPTIVPGVTELNTYGRSTRSCIERRMSAERPPGLLSRAAPARALAAALRIRTTHQEAETDQARPRLHEGSYNRPRLPNH